MAIQLQPRDLTLFADLGRVQVLDAHTIWQRIFPFDRTRRKMQQRLRQLADEDFLRRIQICATWTPHTNGRLPFVYCLAENGALLLEDLLGVRPRLITMDSTRAHKVLHKVECAKVKLALYDSAAKAGLAEPHIIDEHDAVANPAKDAKMPERFRLYHKFDVGSGENAVVWPDFACSLTFPLSLQPLASPQSSQAEGASLIGYFEIDRSTEDLGRIKSKLPGYRQLLARRTFLQDFPAVNEPTVRVLFVVRSEERMRNISQVIREQSCADFCRLAIATDITADSVIGERIWRSPSGERLAIWNTSSTISLASGAESVAG